MELKIALLISKYRNDRAEGETVAVAVVHPPLVAVKIPGGTAAGSGAG